MKVKYKSQKYNVKFLNAISIWKRKILLFLRRVKRFGLRLLYVFKKDLIILFITIIFYVLIVSIVETKVMKKELGEIIWNTKEEVFTVFIVVALNSIISSERNWRENISKWHNVYTENMYYFERDIRELNVATCINVEMKYNMLYTKELYEKFKSEVYGSSKESIINKNEIIKILTRLNREIDELKIDFYRNDFFKEKFGFTDRYVALKDNIYDLRCNLDDGEQSCIKEKLILIYNDLYNIISYTRRLWRTEINLEREIIEILSIDNKKIIDEDFYLKSLSYK